MLANANLGIFQPKHLHPKHLLEVIVQALWILFLLVCRVLEGAGHCQTEIEQAGRKRECGDRVNTGFLSEVLNVAAPVNELEVLLVKSIAQQILAKACATTDHLPKLNLGTNLLKEDQVQNFRHIDTGIQHIDGYCHLR